MMMGDSELCQHLSSVIPTNHRQAPCLLTPNRKGGKMYQYIESEPGVWTVGTYDPKGGWLSESDHPTPTDAARRTSWLNGALNSPGPTDCHLDLSQASNSLLDIVEELKKLNANIAELNETIGWIARQTRKGGTK